MSDFGSDFGGQGATASHMLVNGSKGADRNANTIHRDPADSGKDILDTDDALTAEFRYRIGLLPEEEEGLSDAFKASIGLEGPEPMLEVSEIDVAYEKQYEATLKGFKFEKFAKKNFQGGQNASFTGQPIKEPLLIKQHDVDKLVSPLLFLGIQRFMGDVPTPDVMSNHRDRTPVMTRIYKTIEMAAKRRSSASSTEAPEEKELIALKGRKDPERRKSWRKVFDKSPSEKRLSRTTSTSSGDMPPPDMALDTTVRVENIPTDELDLIHYIIGHGILRKDLRDEIYCQLCKQIRQNPSKESCLRAWILMALCAGCFIPSDQLTNYIQSALRECPSQFKDYSLYTRRTIKRTVMNGPRYHPPNWLEYQANKMRKYVLLPVALPDGRMQSIEADSAITAGEICTKVATEIGLKDQFGFSMFITIHDKVSSLGSGLDHVMDAISECEQLVRSKGKREEDAPWRLYYRKEVFVPWHNPEYCKVSTDLIYRQIAKGIRTEEYKSRAEDELIRFVARRWYVDHGPDIIPGKLQATLHEYLPRSALSGARSRDGWVQGVLASFAEQGFDKKCVPAEQVKWHIVVSAPNKWPLQFSGLFEAFRVSGPRLPRNDVVIAVCGRGLFILDEPYKVVNAYRFYEIVEVFASRSTRSRGQTFSLISIKGDEFTFMSPNSETIARLVTTFLDGLRQRSKVAVGLQDFMLEDAGKKATFQFIQGDVLELLDDAPSREDWIVGIVERTGAKGEFPIDAAYILPAMEKPPSEFLQMFSMMTAADASTLPRKRGAVRLENASKTDTIRHHGLESAA